MSRARDNANLSPTIADARMPNLTGDVTTSEGAVATTIATDAVDIAMLSATGTADGTTFLRGDNAWAAAGGGVFSSYAILLWEETANTASGTLTAGAWRTVTINTEYADPDNIVTISSNQFTLGAGTYYIEWMSLSVKTDESITQLYDITGTATVKSGMSSWAAAGSDPASVNNVMQGCARVSPSGSNAYEIQVHTVTTRATNGFGIASNRDSKNEHYATVKIFKES